MAILHKLLFFLVLGLICAGAFALTLEFLGAGGYAQTKFDYTLDLAQQGNARAQVNLGLMYYQGEGVPRDYQEALKWWRKAADQGDADAQFNLGLSYEKGLGVPQDYQEAFKWFQMAAGQGDAAAQFKLAAMYHKGEGVPKDYVLAYMWWDLSLSQKTDDDARKKEFEWLNLLEKKMTTEQIAEAQRLAREWKPKGKNE